MKKYNLFLGIIAVLSVACLSACEENNGTRTVVYSEQPHHLTIMTQTTTTPADTYSEYMATYTEEEDGTKNYYAIPNMHGVGADTTMGSFPQGGAVTAAPITDTAAALPETTSPPPPPEVFPQTTETASSPSAEEAAESSGPSSDEGSEASETNAAVTAVTTLTSPLELPAPDTASPHAAQADTAPTMYSERDSDSNSESSGTDAN